MAFLSSEKIGFEFKSWPFLNIAGNRRAIFLKSRYDSHHQLKSATHYNDICIPRQSRQLTLSTVSQEIRRRKIAREQSLSVAGLKLMTLHSKMVNDNPDSVSAAFSEPW